MRMLVESSDDETAADPSLLRIIARAHHVQARLIQNLKLTVHDIAREERMSAADFHAAIIAALSDVGIQVHIDESPNELPDPIRFSEDRVHAAYDADNAQRFWRELLQADRVFKAFRTSFIGKCSPVQHAQTFYASVSYLPQPRVAANHFHLKYVRLG
jgi:hypothetical protein